MRYYVAIRKMDTKLAESIIRFREHAIRLQEQRPRTILTTYVPSRTVDAPPPVAKQKKTGPQCSARTLEGRQCPFSAAPECSGFCKKHFSMK